MASLAPGQRYDLVVFGATGFTGQYVVEEVARVAEKERTERKTPLTWAIAGRSEKKLQWSLAEAQKELGLYWHCYWCYLFLILFFPAL